MYKLKSNYYKGIVKIYFEKTLDTIIDLGSLNKGEKKILDFGCGYGYLKKKIKNNTVINYDIDPNFTEIKEWRNVKFDYLVANQVLYLFSKDEICKFLEDLREINPNLKLIVGISYQNLLSKIFKSLLNHADAHKYTKTSFNEQINIIKQYCKLLSQKNNFFMNKVFLFDFK